MKATKILSLMLVVMLALCSLAVAGAEGAKRTIVVDGGGDQNNFNSTKTMEKSDANPYPYNELEVLVNEYNAMQSEVEVQLLPESKSTSREAVVALMTANEAPDIIYQNMGVYKNTDIGTDWFVPLNDYFEQPNPYEEGNTRWADMWNPMWLEVTRSSNNNYYFVPLDAIPVGLIYNMDLLKAAGIETLPETYAEFMDCLEKLEASGTIPYMTPYHWYDIVLEGQMLAYKVEELDVLRTDGVLDSEEFARAFKKGLLSIEDEGYQEWLRVIKEKTKYYPDNWQNADATTMFLNGEVAIIEGIGVHMRNIMNDTVHTFEVATGTYPIVTKETSELADKAVIRGSAGFSTTWQVTKTAVNNGTVEDCIDFLMYLTAKDQNARMINPFSTTTPSNINAEPVDLFKPLVEKANEDMKNGFLDWHACAVYAAFDNELISAYEDDLYPGYILGEISAEEYTEEYQYEIEEAIDRAEATSGWDESKW